MACPGVSLRELYIGSIINVYSRQLKLTEYGDLFTRNKFESSSEKTFALIKPDCYTKTGKIISEFYRNGFTISKLKMSRFSRPQMAENFYAEHRGKPFFNDLASFMSSDVVTGIELISENAVQRSRDVIGDQTAPEEAKRIAPNSIRARFGTDSLRNAIHGSKSSSAYQREQQIFFSPDF